jgi:hypothetical protein
MARGRSSRHRSAWIGAALRVFGGVWSGLFVTVLRTVHTSTSASAGSAPRAEVGSFWLSEAVNPTRSLISSRRWFKEVPMHHRSFISLAIACLCLVVMQVPAKVAAAGAGSGLPQDPGAWPPSGFPQFLYPVAPPQRACVCSPVLFLPPSPDADQRTSTHYWWVLADGSGKMTVSVFARGIAPDAHIQARISDQSNNERGKIGPVDYPGSADAENSGTRVSEVTVPAGTVYAVQIDQVGGTPGQFLPYRLETHGVVQAGMTSPGSAWVPAAESFGGPILTTSSTRATKFRLFA